MPVKKSTTKPMPQGADTMRVATTMRPKKRMELQLQNAYQADGRCYYCGVCLVDGPSPDFEVAYLAVVLS